MSKPTFFLPGRAHGAPTIEHLIAMTKAITGSAPTAEVIAKAKKILSDPYVSPSQPSEDELLQERGDTASATTHQLIEALRQLRTTRHARYRVIRTECR